MSIDHGKVLALAKKLAPLKAMPFEFDNGPAGDDQWCVCTKDSNLTGCDMDKEDAELFAYAVNALAQPAEAVEGPLPPEAVEVFPSALNGGTALPGDWAIPRAPGINRIVDARMAYGWNECRKEMRRRPTLAAGDDVTDAAQGAVAWRPMETAPRDGTMLRLLVEFTEHATEDSQDPSPTIGANNFYNDGEDEWLFAGWCWTHDHFTQGEGTPVGWLPLLDTHPQAAPAQGDGKDCTCQKYEGRDCRRCFNPPYPDGNNPPPLWGTKHWQGSILQMVGEMRNFADVADRCELTEGNAPAVIRLWADRLAAAPSQEPQND